MSDVGYSGPTNTSTEWAKNMAASLRDYNYDPAARLIEALAAERDALKELGQKHVDERDAARAEVARLREATFGVLYVAARELYGAKIARHLVTKLEWPFDAPTAVHESIEAARAALAQKDPQP